MGGGRGRGGAVARGDIVVGGGRAGKTGGGVARGEVKKSVM